MKCYKVVTVIRDEYGYVDRKSAMWDLLGLCGVTYPTDGQWAHGYHGTPVMVFDSLAMAWYFMDNNTGTIGFEIWEVECKNLRKPDWILSVLNIRQDVDFQLFWECGRWYSQSNYEGWARKAPPDGTLIADEVRLVHPISIDEARAAYNQWRETHESL